MLVLCLFTQNRMSRGPTRAHITYRSGLRLNHAKYEDFTYNSLKICNMQSDRILLLTIILCQHGASVTYVCVIPI